MKSLEEELKDSIQGEVHFDAITRHVYSVDASIFEIVPIGVVIPKNQTDLANIVEIARHFGIPISARGAATGIAGGCLGEGLVVDLSKYLNRIHTISIDQTYVVCEPGVVQDQLNFAVAPFGYRLGPDTSTGNRATLGGMLANNAAGARSLHFGKMSDHVQSVELLLSSGKLISFSSISEEEWRKKRQQEDQEGEIYRVLWEVKQQYANEIQKRFFSLPRRVSGYNLDELLKPLPFNVARIIAGSEGTLGIATEIKMGIVPKLKATGLLLLFFDNMLEAFKQAPHLLEYQPISLEMIDHQIIELGRASPTMKNKLDWLKGDPKAILIIEIEGNDATEVQEKIRQLCIQMNQAKIGIKQIPILNPETMKHVWDLRKSGLGILLSKRTYSRAIAFIEDLSIPPLKLADFMEKLCNILQFHGKQVGIYGHAGAGCMHIRPYLDLRHPEELDLMRHLMSEISSLVLEFEGALSGEHGDGWIRSWLNPKMFGNTLMQAFKKIKDVFDPFHLMNPGKIIPEQEPWDKLRTTPGEILQSPKTFLDFKSEGGFELAADLCNGNGLCRKKEGVMCPSFQATNDEFHSTRARAQALRAIIHRRLPLEAFTSQGLHAVMDLCLMCKGCKTECPSEVDMAKFKSEFLYHYQEKHGYTLRSRLFGSIGQMNSWMSSFPLIFNRINESSWMKNVLEWIGISAKRSLPLLAKRRFSDWFSQYVQPSSLAQRVVVLNDTFTEFNHPEVGEATVRVLNALGFRVILPAWSCCGRPALSKGLLPLARKQAKRLIANLLSYTKEGFPIVGIEPSCLLTLRDDYLSLIHAGEEEEIAIRQLLSQCFTLDEFLAELIREGMFTLKFKEEKRKIKVHGHCYQKALVGMMPTLSVLNAIPGFSVEEIPSGCCGMAGSFGYELEHEALSMQIGELSLFPAVRSSGPEDWIIANGMSCRHQIKDGTQRKALHLAEALNNHLSVTLPLLASTTN